MTTTAALKQLTREERIRLLALLEQAKGAGAKKEASPAIRPAPRDGALPLSFAQQRLWFLDRLDGRSTAYNMPLGLRLTGTLDRAALQRALDRIVARHEALRTRFTATGGAPEQRIAPAGTGFLLVDEDLRGQADAAARVDRIAQAEAAAAFDLEHGPLIRGRLLALDGQGEEEVHVLLVTMHHIVSDGWSLGVLTRELSALYSAFSQGQDDPLPAMSIQYADYAAWQQQALGGEVLQRQKDYWAGRLGGAPVLLQLPTDRPRPAQQDPLGASLAIALDKELTAQLKALGRRHGTTLHMTLLAAWGALLARLSGQDDIVIGTPVANRTRVELEGLIGFFVNTLALRLDLAGSPSTAQLLQRVKTESLNAQQHQDLPFEQVVEAVKPARSMAHTPLFQAMFSWQNNTHDRLDLPALRIESLDVRNAVAKYDLTLDLGEADGCIVGRLDYAAALFDRATIERHAGYLQALLRAMAADEQQPVDRIALLGDAERNRLLVEWNATQAEAPPSPFVHTLIEAHAARAPDALAVTGDGSSLTYGELDAQANRLAHHLRSLGVAPDSRVAVHLPRGNRLVVAVLAVLKAGGAYVPLDTAHPADRLAFMLQDSAPAVLLTQGGLAALDTQSVPVIDLDADAHLWAHQPAQGIAPAAIGLRPDHLAYVIYTSGSTGQPKGVGNTVEGLLNRLWWYARAIAGGTAPVTALKTSIGFVDAVTEMLQTLVAGGRLVVFDQATAGDPALFASRVRADGISSLVVVPSLLARLLESDPAAMASVRTLVCSGERLPPELVRAVRQAHPALRLYNFYGSSEVNGDATAFECAADAAEGMGSVIGRPIANTRIYLLDAHGQPVPTGTPGELHVGGKSIARGYLGQPALTAERFVDDPFHGGRMYRTGDLARYLPDGNIEFLGRNDFQVKIRGFRIELGEIEARLAQLPGVHAAAVVARDDSPGDTRLVAYVVADAGIGPGDLRAQLAAVLPDYMVPAAFVLLDALPRTFNGKLDRQALPAPGQDAYASADYAAPEGELEATLARLWSELLNVERIGRDDDFFALGGHSLLAVRMASRLRAELGVEVPLGALFAHPRLQALAAAVGVAQRSELPAVTPVPREGSLPLSFAQQRLWFLAQLDARATMYHMPLGLRMAGALDQGALRRALDRIVARHEALRTHFVVQDGQPVQRIAPADTGFALHLHDLHGAPDADAQAEALRLREANDPFDLEQGPLVRGRLLVLGEDDHLLLLTMHHIVSDAWSVGVMTRELGALYAAFARGEADPLPALPIQYADYAAWQHRWLAGEVLQRQGEYWRRRLADAPAVLELFTDRRRPARQDHRGAVVPIALDAALSTKLKALGQRHGTTLHMTLLAAWSALLARLSGQEELVIGTPVANRTRVEIEGLIGFFINTLALRLDVGGSPSTVELLQRVKAESLNAQQHQDLPFEQVVEVVKPARSLAHTPIFQVTFSWLGAGQPLDLPGLALRPVEAPLTGSKFDLELTLGESENGIAGGLVYASALFDAATMERHAGYYKALLQAMVADELQPVDRLELLDADERHQLLVAWNATGAEYPRDRCIHELFEDQVRRTPDAPAVLGEDAQLSYAELHAKACSLAVHLRSLGVGAGSHVAILLDRSIELVWAQLAVLQCGAAYVPLDLNAPPERQAFMVADCQAPVVLTLSRLPVPQTDAVRVDLDALSLDAGAPSAQVPTDSLAPACVMYTSGSTGQPKGVVVPHRAIARLVLNNHYAQFRSDDRVAFTSNPAFDSSSMEVWAPLLHGACIVVVSNATLLQPAALATWLTRSRVSILHLVAGLLSAYVQPLASVFPTLRYLLTGGDVAVPRAIAQVLKDSPPQHLIHCYGPSETTTFATTCELTAVAEDARVPIGKPIANTRVYLLDRHSQPVPRGVTGELYIAGDGVAQGYLNRPELTAEKFLQDPFAGGRMYRTGDLARYLPDSNIEFLGRNDFQVKIRGFRIELGEIEARLAEHALVREAVVLEREDTPGDKRLVAYYTAAEEQDTEIDFDWMSLVATASGHVSGEAEEVHQRAIVLRAHLAATLPEYMLPAAFVALEALPLTPNGKLDRRALPAPEADAYAARAYEAPEGELETSLAALWCELLQVPRAGRHDDFFALGGHSLLAMRLVSRLRHELGVELSLGDVFEHAELRALAASIGGAAPDALSAIEPVPRDAPLPLSFAQQRLWFLAQLESLSLAYHMPVGLRLSGPLDKAALRRALDRIVARHEALRTGFAESSGDPVQVIAPADTGFTLVVHDLQGQPDAVDQVRALGTREATDPFDLVHGPLIRGRLLVLGDAEHVLLLTMHHIVSDGWSMGVLTRELGALYAAFAEGRPDPLPPLPIQYADYAAWQRRWLDGEVLRRQSEYWKNRFADAPALLEVPADRPRPTHQDHRGAVVPVALDDALSAKLKALSQRHGATLHMTLLAAWSALLGRLSGQDDIVIGTPVANRTRVEVEGLIGFFINTLALRIDLGGSPNTVELLQRVKAESLNAQQHQDLSFEQVVEIVKPVRSLAHTPLFQVMFSWQNNDDQDIVLQGLRVEPVGTGGEIAKYDLTLELAEVSGRIGGGIAYASALFDEATVERYAGYLRNLLEGMVADEERAVTGLPMLSASEREQLLVGWNATQAEYPSTLCMHELVETQARVTPEAVALVHGGRSLRYSELEAQSNRLAHHLRTLGVGPDARVAVCVQRSERMVVALLAVLKAGGAYVPLDPAYPAERLAYMLQDSEPRVMLTDGPVPDGLLGSIDLPVLDLTVDAASWAGLPATPIAAASIGLRPNHLAYIIYTSGSTGHPKGVMIEHRNAVNFIAWARSSFAPSELRHTVMSTSLNFDLAVYECWVPLASGGCVEVVADALALVHMPDVPASLVNTVPSAIKALLDESAVPASVRTVNLAGEPLKRALVEQLFAQTQVERVCNLYGPSETTTYSTWVSMPRESGFAPHVGRPVANTRIYLLDAHGQPVPIGVVGELYIAGDGVARGYLNRPELTAERFLQDPFAGGRMYRTGDLARYLPDGNIEFLGRNDFQVKVRGFRIELGEIEARLAQIAGVREAAVLAREDSPGDKRLIAYVVADESVQVTELRTQLSATLPEYMVPAAFVQLDALPLTPNGKLDRKALPAPDALAYAQSTYEPPEGELETALAALWCELLQLPQVGRHDDFFALGGHSLLAVRLVSRLRHELGVELPLGALFEHPRLDALARAVPGAVRSVLPPIEPAPRDAPLPLSFAQQRLWFLTQLDAHSAAYHVPIGLRLSGLLDRAALRRALDRIVARHEALRTSFVVEGGLPVQRIAPPDTGIAFEEHDLRGDADAAARIDSLAANEAAMPFDLERGPLIRCRLIVLGEQDHLLLVTLHHIVSDGWSLDVLLRELAALYGAFAEGRGDPLPALSIQYADYAAWQRRWLEGEVLRRQADYWKQRLGDAPALLELPTDRARPMHQDHAGARLGFELDPALAAALKSLAQRHGTTLYATLLAAWGALLGRLSGQDDIVIGTPVANRTRVEVEGLIGFFVNTLALRLDLGGNASTAGMLRRVRAELLNAQQHQDLPFEQVVEIVKPARSLAHTPVFQVMLSWQAESPDALALLGLQLQPVAASNTVAKFDLLLGMGEMDGRVGGSLEYATALFDEATIARHLARLRRLLEAMVTDEQQPMARLEILDDAERNQLLVGWNATQAEYPSTLCMHELVEVQAGATPEAVALVHGERRLSYRELDAQSNRLAHHLRTLGVGPDARVAVCVQRSERMVVALLAVLKAGGAYVPLDPAYPAERLAYMLQDSQPRVMLTDGPVPDGLLDSVDLPVLDLARDAALWAELPATPIATASIGLRPDHLAYIIYTSGSTGHPKGVMIEHRNAVNFIAWARSSFDPSELRHTVMSTSLNFDLAVYECWVPLASGGCVEVVADALALVHMPDVPASLVNTVPSAIKALLDEHAVPTSVRTVNLAGEPLKRALVEQLFANTHVERVCNLYGPSETTTYSTWVSMPRESGFAPHVGRPVANTRIYLLDVHGQPVPIGVVGELYIAGDGVARGYLNRPELTAERFLQDPFASGRMYRTGDLARYLPDGNIEFLGRNDFQVKVRGFRIELGEIEARLAQISGVREAAVLAREDTPGDKRLVAYVVANADVQVSELRAQLCGVLPEYMVPAAFVQLDALPLTPNGKLDRRALPAPDALAYAQQAYEPPEGETETALAALWSELLDLPRVGRHDDFFALGGHSLLAMRLLSRLRTDLGVELPLSQLFEHPQLSGQAQALGGVQRTALPAIQPASREQALPLSFAQQRLWFLTQLDAHSRAYHMPLGLRLAGPLDRVALQRALDRIVARHESLRTTFALENGAPVQRIARADTGFKLHVHDLRNHAQTEADVQAHATQEAGDAFDLSTGPLIRGRLLVLGDAEHVLLITMHHIVSDGWSMGVLTQELSALYGAFAEGREDPLAPLPIQYADYAAWQRHWLEGEVLQRQGDYWKSRLAGAPALLELPTDHPRPAQQDHRGALVTFELEAPLATALKALCQRQRTTLYMTLLAAWAALLARLSGQDDIVIGTPVANRTRAELEGLIGFFVNALALRIDLADAPSTVELLQRVKAESLDAQQHQDLPFEQVVEIAQPARSMAHTPLFQVVFSWQADVQGAAELSGLASQPIAAPIVLSKFDLTLHMGEAEGRIAGGFEYATALFEQDTIERFSGHFQALLRAMVADEARPVAELPLLSDAERDQLLVQWNVTPAPFPVECIHALFEAQALRTPDAVALVHGEHRVRYAELDAQANRLAHHLRTLGVGPDARVAVCMQRSERMVVALLAVLKAGGGYVPMDPAYPAERLAYMLQDSDPRVLISDGELPEGLADGLSLLVLDLQADAGLWASLPPTPIAASTIGLRPEHLAYVIYTSGST
ncbi:MAG: non-ribosomal peptide synthase/polyketide synthase, partial [Pseudomonadota bacterium]